MHPFDLTVPTALDEALEILDDPDAQPLAGGQTLIPTLKARLAAPAHLVSLRRITELRGIEADAGHVTIGAMTPHAVVARQAHDVFPALAKLAGTIGDPMVRNRGTIGGSLANNDPSACYPSAVLASNATIVTTARQIAADAFFDGLFTTALDEGELIRKVRFPIPIAANYQKFCHPASRFALTGVFVAKFATGIRVAVTGAGEDGVFRWHAAEEALGAACRPETVEALDLPDEPMMADMHGSREYRAHLARVFTARAVAAIES